MQTNPEIEHIIEQSLNIARKKNHEYVMSEHLLVALLQHQPFRTVLVKFGADVDAIQNDVDAYLDSLVNLCKPDVDQPKKTNALERVFNRALTQVLFTGRRTMTTADLYLSIMAESNSHAQYFKILGTALQSQRRGYHRTTGQRNTE